MTRPIRVAILGASGYGAGELLRLLVAHPRAEVVSLVSSSHVGAAVAALHPHLRGFYDLPVESAVAWDRLRDGEAAVVFSALPHGASGEAVAEILRAQDDGRLRIIDLSGDLRLTDAVEHARHYPESSNLGELRGKFAYGLTEVNRAALRSARFVANPGCLASAATLALAPLAAILRGPVAVDAKTGSSGSGRSLKEGTHHPLRHADFRAYKPLAHAHEPEVLQALGDPRGERIEMSFVAQSMDTARGIFVSAHATLPEETTAAALRERYAAYYAESPFVRVVESSPTLQDVVGSNFCDVSVACRGRRVIAMAALDNLVKGMAGTAIQNMNLLCGLPETTGLWTPSFRPV